SSTPQRRTGTSTSSQTTGVSSRRSMHLALTDLTSQAEAYGPHAPWPRAEPVMLESAVGRSILGETTRGPTLAAAKRRHKAGEPALTASWPYCPSAVPATG